MASCLVTQQYKCFSNFCSYHPYSDSSNQSKWPSQVATSLEPRARGQALKGRGVHIGNSNASHHGFSFMYYNTQLLVAFSDCCVITTPASGVHVLGCPSTRDHFCHNSHLFWSDGRVNIFFLSFTDPHSLTTIYLTYSFHSNYMILQYFMSIF